MIAAILGILTSISFFMVFNMTFNGQFEDMSMEGTIVDEKGIPIDGAQLTILDENITTTTDSNGSYSYQNLPSGTHTLRITAPGQTTLYYRFTLAAWSIYEEDFALENASGGKDNKTVDESAGDEMYNLPTFMFLSSTITFLGGLAARKKKHWFFCVIASIIGFFSLGLVFVSPLLTIIALVILFRTRWAFDGKSHHR